MEWKRGWQELMARARSSTPSPHAEVDALVDGLYNMADGWKADESYRLLLPQPYQFSTIKEVYHGLPEITEMITSIEGWSSRLRIVCHAAPRQFWVLDMHYSRSNHKSGIDTQRTINFADPSFRIRVIEEALTVINDNKGLVYQVRGEED